jgi:AcrR family transcriptional regulator
MSPSRDIGRPRSEKARTAILEAAFELLAERGFPGFAIEAVAIRAGVAKTTIYRWWPSKADLAIDAFLSATDEELRLAETGSAERDFRAHIADLAVLLRGQRGRAFAGMLAGSAADPALAYALANQVLAPRRSWGLERILRARDAGELRPGVDPAAALSVLYGPLWAPLLFGEQVPTFDEVAAYLDIACAGIFAR